MGCPRNDSDIKKHIGQRVWFDDQKMRTGDFVDMPSGGLLIRIIYYSDNTKQIQMGTDYYYEVDTPLGVLRKNDNDKEAFLAIYPNAIVIEGEWVADDYYFAIVEEAMASKWNDGN